MVKLLMTLLLTVSLAKVSKPSPTIPIQNEILSPSGQTLKDAIDAALKRSESINIQKELATQAQEAKSQAVGAFMPTITGSGNWPHQNLPQSGVTVDNQRTLKLMGDQPLFRGLRDFATLRQKKFLVEAQQYAFAAAAKQLFFDVATAYYNVIMLASDESNYRREIEVNQKRLGELRHFIKIGRSRDTELLSFQANIANLEAQAESTHGQLESAKETLAFLTGWDRNSKLNDTESITARDLNSYLEKIEQRPDVRSAVSTSQANLEGISAARAGHLPSLDLLGNYYFDRPFYGTTQPDWDVQLALTIPIFEGGIVQSQVRQAQSVAVQYELLASQARRAAEQEIRQLYDTFTAGGKQISKLELAVQWSKKNYEATLRDYRNGLVTNLDVLEAITTYQDSQRLLDRQRFLVKTDGVKLQAAAGERAEINIQPEKEQ